MKTWNAVSLFLAVVGGFVLGTALHPFSALADTTSAKSKATVVITSFSTGGLTGPGVAGRQELVDGRQVVGFSCISSGPQAGNCYIASVK